LKLCLSMAVAVLVTGLLGGCGNIFAAKHKITVDAIAAAGVAKPAGQSFRLVAKKSILSQGQVNVSVISACVTAALAHAGMFEAPAIAPPDLVIEVNCGQEAGPRTDPGSRETYLELSARTNKARAMDSSRDPEIWNVRVSVHGLVGRIETAMPVLSAVAASYVATDTKVQTMIEVPQNSASIKSVRETALKTLDANAAPAASPAVK
jgi:hypothetical protein